MRQKRKTRRRCADVAVRAPSAYAVRLPHALLQRLDHYLTWQRQHAAADTELFCCRAEAARWLLSWAIDAVIRAHEDRVAAEDLAALFAQSPSPKAASSRR